MKNRNKCIDRSVSVTDTRVVTTKRTKRTKSNGSGKVLTLFIAALTCIMLSTFFVSAQEPVSSDSEVLYKSIVIQSGDTLWGIAQEYITSDCDTTNEYVNKLIRLNGLTSDSIQSGMSLIVAYEPEHSL